MKQLTKEQAVIISAYTGILAGNFDDFHAYAEHLLGRPIWTHEFANKELANLIKEKSQKDFLAIVNK